MSNADKKDKILYDANNTSDQKFNTVITKEIFHDGFKL